jgi:hypothetical protein
VKVTIKAASAAARDPKAGKVTCQTCKLKGCVGRCVFKVQNPNKAA